MSGTPRAHPAPPAPPAPRTTETALSLPSLGRGLTLLGRALRLRCPHCGTGPVLRGWDPQRWGSARERCSGCGFRFTRSDDRYFAGAMLPNLLMAELTFALVFVAVVLLTWPDVPWDGLTYGIATAMAVGPFALYPVSMVVWLTLDVLVRPVTPDELEPADRG
jgi:uncharacterized protein (DUF983 family)